MLKTYSIATGSEQSTKAAADILDNGGNAYDAILAALFMSFVCEPLLSSPGGGGYLLAKPHNKSAKLIDFFAQTPHNKSLKNKDFYPINGDFGAAQQEFHIGMASIAIPGVPAGIFSIHKHYCQLPLIDCAQAAINKAKQGATVTDIHANVIQILSPLLKYSKESHSLFSQQQGHLLKAGDVKQNNQLAFFLKDLASHSEDWFYRGSPADAIVSDMRQNNGMLRICDFESYAVNIRNPLQTKINNWKIITNAAPTSGGHLIIQQLQHAFNSAKKNDSIRIIEAMIHADHLKNNQNFQSSKGTTHMSVIDQKGNVASLTVSNGEGSGYIAPNCGFMLNNFLGEEDINAPGFFKFKENTRMASMMSPTIIKNKYNTVALGTGGSNRIKTAMFQVIWRIIAENKTLDQAINHPRFHYENGVLDIEKGIKSTVINQIKQMQLKVNRWQQRSLYFGGINAVQMGLSHLAIADSRRKGVGLVSLSDVT